MKIALNAGHGYNTSGKRCLKSIDKNETREYVLNKRICDKVESALKRYNNIEVLRIDDGTELSITARTNKANKWGADFYLAIHHNAGVNGGSGGGLEAYTYTKVDKKTEEWQNELYKEIVALTGLKGNRSNPLKQADLGECRQSKMPAVLLECGFMDSTIDTPIILTEDFADKVATAIVKVITKKSGANVLSTAVPVKTQSGEISVTYQVFDNIKKKWLPNVKNLTDYAGILGHDASGVFCNLSGGNIFYRVHIKGGGWLPVVKNREDYAGIKGKPIDAFCAYTDTGKTLRYAVHIRSTNRWLPFVTGFDINDSANGYAGIIGRNIDGLKMYIE